MIRKRTGLLAGFVSLSLLRLVSAALSFGLVVYLARVLGPGPLGAFSLVMGVFVLLQYVPAMGLHVAITRNTAAMPTDAARQLVNGCLLALPMAFVAVVALAIGSRWVGTSEPGTSGGILLVGAALLPTAFTTIVEAVLVGREQSGQVALVGLIEAVGRTVASLVAIRAGFGVEALFVLFAAGRVAAALAYLRSRAVRELLRRDCIDPATLRTLASRIPVFFSIMILAQLMERMDFLILGALAGVRELGLYTAPYKLYELLLMAPRIASLLLLPRFAACLAIQPGEFDAFLQSTLRLGLAVGLPAVLIAAFFAADAMRVFGREYQGESQLFAMLCVAVLGVGLNNLLSIVLIVTGNQRRDLAILVVSTLAYGLMLIYLVSAHGAWGAAVATLAIGFLQPALAVLLLRHRIAIGTSLASLARAATAGLALSGVLWFAEPLSVVVRVVAALAIYAAVLAALHAVSRRDLETLDIGLRARHAGGA